MPVPKKITQQEFDKYYEKNRKWFDSHNWNKDLARSAYIARSLNQQGYGNIDINKSPDQYSNEELSYIYENGFDGYNPYKLNSEQNTNTNSVPSPNPYPSSTPTLISNTTSPRSGNPILNPEDFGAYDSFVTEDGAVGSASVIDSNKQFLRYDAREKLEDSSLSDRNMERTRFRYNYSDEDFDAMRRSKKIEDQLRLPENNLVFTSIKDEMAKKLEQEHNTYFTGKYSDHFDSDYQGISDKGNGEDWWYYAASYYYRLKNEEGEESATNWLNQAVQKRVMDTQTGWEATKEIPQQFLNNFVSGGASDIGIVWGLTGGLVQAIFNPVDGLNFGQSYANYILNNDLMQYAGKVMEQGRVFTSNEFDPETQMAKSFIAPQNVGAAAAAQTAYGAASIVVGGAEKMAAKGVKAVAKNAGRTTARQARNAASRSATRLATETEEEFLKRQAKMKQKQQVKDKVADYATSAQFAFGEAALDANDVYNQSLEYAERATDAAANINAQNRLYEEFGISGDINEWVSAMTMNYLNGEAPDNVYEIVNSRLSKQTSDQYNGMFLSADDYNSVYHSIEDGLRTKFLQYVEEEQSNMDDVHSNNLAVALKTGMLTLAAEGATVFIADRITDHTLSRESHRNIRRREGKGNINTDRGLTWNKDTKRVELNMPSSADEWKAAGKKWFVDATVGEVLPENIQNLVSNTNQEIAMNAIDQYIVARSNGDEAKIGDLHFGNGGFNKGLSAGWKATRSEIGNTTAITYLSTLMPNFNPSAIRGIVHRPENTSVWEHLNNLLGNGVTRNYFEEVNKDKHVRFYNDEINKLLDDAPWLQEALQEGITLKNYSDMITKAYNAGDMAAAEQAELGQLVTLLSHMNAVNVKNSPLSFINDKIESIKNAASNEEEKKKIVDAYLEKNKDEKLLREGETIENLSDERRKYFFDSILENAERMEKIQQSVQKASDMVRENYSTYDERVQNSLIFGKVFNETLESDISREREILQKTISQSKAQQPTTSSTSQSPNVSSEPITMDKISDNKNIARLNRSQEKLSRLNEELKTMAALNGKSGKEVFDYVSNAYKENPNVSVTNENFEDVLKRRIKAYQKEAKNTEKEIKKLKKETKGVTDTDISVTADTLINGDAEVRRFLLNRNNWDMLSQKTKKQLKEVTESLMQTDPSFIQNAYILANNEVMMGENRDALTAYLMDPDKLRPTFQRIARMKRDKQFASQAVKLNEIEDFEEFKKAYDEATRLDNKKTGGKSALRYYAERSEKIKAINEKLKNNKNYKKYMEINEKSFQLREAVKDVNISSEYQIPINASEETKNEQNRRKLQNTLLIKYLTDNKIDITDENAVMAALEETIDGQPIGGRSYFEYSKYGKFIDEYVKDHIQQQDDNIFTKFPPHDFMFDNPGAAFTAFKKINDRSDILKNIKAKAGEAPDNPGTATQVTENSMPEEKLPFDGNAAYDDRINNGDDEKYNAEIDIESFDDYYKKGLNELSEYIIRLLTYGFRVSDSVIDVIKPKVENYLKILKGKDAVKDNIDEINKIIKYLHKYASTELDIQKSPIENLKIALSKLYNNKKIDKDLMLDANKTGLYFINIINEAFKDISFDKNVAASSQKIVEDTLKRNAVESMNASRSGNRNEALSGLRDILFEFSAMFGTQQFLNSRRAGTITTRKAPMFIVSGRALFDNNNESLNSRIKALYGEKYDEDKHGALAVVVRIDEETKKSWEKDDSFTNKFIQKKGIDGKDEYYQVVAFLPPATDNPDDQISQWRQKNALWDNEDDMMSSVSTKKILYLHNKGLKYALMGTNNQTLRPLNSLTAFGGFPKIFGLLRREHRKLRNGDDYVMLSIDATGNGQFSVFSEDKNRDSIEVLVRPMSQSTSVQTGRTIVQILKDGSPQELLNMHHTEVKELQENGKSKDIGSWGRMGQFFFSMRRMLLEKQYDSVSGFVGNTKDADDRYNGNKIILELASGYSIEFDSDENEFILTNGDNINISLGKIEQDLIERIDEFRENNNITTEIDDFTPEYTDEEKETIKNAASLSSPIDEALAEEMDKFIFEFAKNLILNDGKDNIATVQITKKHNDGTSEQKETERVKWNLFYGTPAQGYDKKPIQKIESNDTEENSSSDRIVFKIFKDFYDSGLLVIKDEVQSVFFTDNADKTDQTAPFDNDVTSTSNNARELPAPIRFLVENTKKIVSDIHASVTSLTQSIIGDSDYLDSSSSWGTASTGIGNIIDTFAKNVFNGNIHYNEAIMEYLIYDENGISDSLEKAFPNISVSQLQDLADELYNIKCEFEKDGFLFINDELKLSGNVILCDKDEGTRRVQFPMAGVPDVVAYNPNTGDIRIIDVKNKRSDKFEDGDKTRPIAVLSNEEQKMEKYKNQVYLYAQMIKKMIPSSDSGVKFDISGLYILEVPTSYPNPEKDNVQYHEENGVIMVTNNGTISKQEFGIGKTKLHNLEYKSIDESENTISIHDRYSNLNNQLKSLYLLIEEMGQMVDKYPENKTYAAILKKYNNDADKLSKEINELISVWRDETNGDLVEEAKERNSSSDKGLLDFSQSGSSRNNIQKKENEVENIVKVIKNRILSGKSIGDFITDEDKLKKLKDSAKETGDFDISGYTIEFESFDRTQTCRIDTEHGKIILNENVLIDVVKDCKLDPYTVCDHFINCRI